MTVVSFDVAAERSVLGAILSAGAYGRDAGWRVLARVESTGLHAGHFYLGTHAALFRELQVMRDEGLPLDPLSVSSQLEQRAIDSIGPVAGLIDFDVASLRGRLHQLGHEVTAFSNVEHHARIVLRESLRRPEAA
jgi:replicative DNA helicase